MKSMSKELLGILSPAVREQIKKLELLSLQEIRLKTGCQALVRSDTGIRQLGHIVLQEDITFVINTASRYSPWNARTGSESAERVFPIRAGCRGSVILPLCVSGWQKRSPV